MKRVLILSIVLLFVSVSLEAQEKSLVKTNNKSQDTVIVVDKGQIPVVIIDGKRYDSDILRLIDNNLIASVEVFKGDKAEELYNESAVIVVTTKEKAKEKQAVTIRVKGNPIDGTQNKPVILIDGRVAEIGEMEKISPDKIESISVLKDEASKKKYESEAGVILIVTKKKDQ